MLIALMITAHLGPASLLWLFSAWSVVAVAQLDRLLN